MAITVYPLNDIDYTAEDVAVYNSTRTSGIYAGDDFSISLTGADNTISIDVGLAWMRLSKFNGVAVALKAKTSIDMGIPDATYPRIDALVLQFDANKNGAEIVSKSGTASSNPQPPVLSQTEALYELHLLHVLRKPGATSITAADVTDLRMDEAYCGLMADSVTRVDTTAINAQISELINQLREELAAVKAETAFVMKSGDTMTGPLSLPAPTEAAHSANKGYVDGTVLYATLSASGWSDSAPFTQTVAVAGMTVEDNPDYWPVYSGTNDERIAQKAAFAVLDHLETADGTVTVTCFEEKPETDITIGMEVHR